MFLIRQIEHNYLSQMKKKFFDDILYNRYKKFVFNTMCIKSRNSHSLAYHTLATRNLVRFNIAKCVYIQLQNIGKDIHK